MKRLVVRALRFLPGRVMSSILPPTERFDPSAIPEPVVAPDADVRVYIGTANSAGQSWHIARAMETFLVGVRAVSMAVERSKSFHFASDYPLQLNAYRWSRRWQARQALAVKVGFTHVIQESGRPLFGDGFGGSALREVQDLVSSGLQVALLFYGSDIRSPRRHREIDKWSPFHDTSWDEIPILEAQARKSRDLMEAAGRSVFVTTPDMLLDAPGSTWLPIVVDTSVWEANSLPLQRARPRVVHAPTHAIIKGSDIIEPILKRLHVSGLVEYVRVEGVNADEMPAIYKEADIVLEQFRIGNYATAAIESMAAGRLVVGHVHDQVRDHVLAETGLEVPVVQATVDTLENVLLDILANRERYRNYASTGPRFAKVVHNGEMSAKVLKAFLRPSI